VASGSGLGDTGKVGPEAVLRNPEGAEGIRLGCLAGRYVGSAGSSSERLGW